MLRLRGHVGERERSFLLAARETTVGRSADNDLVLPVRGVSRRHAVVRSGSSSLEIRDLGTANGTFVDGERVVEAKAGVGQQVRFGPVELKVEAIPAEEAELAIVLERPVPGQTADAPWGEPEGAFLERPQSSELLRVEDLVSLVCSGALHRALQRLTEVTGASHAALVEGDEGEEPRIRAVAGSPPEEELISGVVERATRSLQDSPSVPCVRREPHGSGFLSWASGAPAGALWILLVVHPSPPTAEALHLLRIVWWVATSRWSAAEARRRGEGVEKPVETAALSWPDDYVPGRSEPMAELHEQIRQIANADIPVLIQGETGVGKEQVAAMLHRSSGRRSAPLVAINCAAIPKEMLEAELFGVAQGAATGVERRPGRFVAADGGSLFLDEIGELSLDLQAKLLRVLQDREVIPVGGVPRSIDIRPLSATNADLLERVRRGEFRGDLYYRIAGIVLKVPPLRARTEDVPELVATFVERIAATSGRNVRGVTVGALEALCRYRWPGNVRELVHELQRAVHLCRPGEAIDSAVLSTHVVAPPEIASLLDDGGGSPGPAESDLHLATHVERVERALIRRALRATRGNRSEAARRLGISRGGLSLKMDRLGLSD